MVMSSVPFYSTVLSVFAFLVPPYALRLTRVFGTRRVGWVVFSAFTLLAVLQLIRAWKPMGLALDPATTLDLLYLLVPLLLLIGMLHIETVFKERLRVETEERRMRGELEVQVRERTSQLDEANESLQREISLRKQGEQELRKSKEGYRFLFDENPLPMWIFDLRTHEFLAFNNAALRHYGYNHGEFKKLSPADLCVSTEVAAFLESCSQPTVMGKARRVWQHRTKDGAVTEVETTVHDLVYAERPARLVLAYDLSGWRKSEAAQITGAAEPHNL
jgi:PAS domain S-box-containing protein